MTDAPGETRAVRALGTIRRQALAEAARRVDAALARLESVREALVAPRDAERLRGAMRDAQRDLLAADDELAAWSEPSRRQAADRARAREGGSTAD